MRIITGIIYRINLAIVLVVGIGWLSALSFPGAVLYAMSGLIVLGIYQLVTGLFLAVTSRAKMMWLPYLAAVIGYFWAVYLLNSYGYLMEWSLAVYILWSAAGLLALYHLWLSYRNYRAYR